MDSVTLLDRARAAGLRVKADGDQLRVRGPKRHAPLALALLDRKPEVMALLRDEATPTAPCRVCKGILFWRHAEHGHWICRRCHPASFPEDVGEEITVEDTRRKAAWQVCRVTAPTDCS